MHAYLFYTLGYNPVKHYLLLNLFWHWPLASFQLFPVIYLINIFLAHLHFLKLQEAPGSSCVFPNPVFFFFFFLACQSPPPKTPEEGYIFMQSYLSITHFLSDFCFLYLVGVSSVFATLRKACSTLRWLMKDND